MRERLTADFTVRPFPPIRGRGQGGNGAESAEKFNPGVQWRDVTGKSARVVRGIVFRALVQFQCHDPDDPNRGADAKHPDADKEDECKQWADKQTCIA